ncbi:hypothetical protein Tco_0157752 [Tanacetum coccineum]
MEECHKMLTNQINWANLEDLEYLRYGNKGSKPALSISKMKAARYPDFGLELLVPKQMWIDEVCTYDISAAYGISHWWFNRQKFYIERHDSPSRRREFRKHMRILSVVRIKAYSRYGDFEDLNLLLLQGHLNHLPGSRQTYAIYCCQTMDPKLGDLTAEALDYRVKEFKIKRLNMGMNMRFWTQKDVTKSKEFMSAIERLRGSVFENSKTIQESYALSVVIAETFRVIPKYHSEDGNPTRANIKQALGSYKMEMVSSCSSKDKFITVCSYFTNTLKETMKAQEYVSKLPQL